MLTFDEIVYAGGGNSSNSNYYLNNNATTNYWWSLSPYSFNGANGFVRSFIVDDSVVDYDSMGDIVSYSGANLRSAVSLKSGVVFKDGDGTIDRPYTIG